MSIYPLVNNTMVFANDNWRTRFARRHLLQAFAKIGSGTLVIHEQDQTWYLGETAKRGGLEAEITILHPNLWLDTLAHGDLGAAEAYMKGYWQTPDLTAVIRLIASNHNVLQALQGPWEKLLQPALRYLHWLNRNTETNARRNIAAHYDLGNEMFELFLDPSMMYSSAIYPEASSTLEEAATFKLDHICRKLGLQPGMQLLEIGTGWGGLAIHAAKHYGCHVTTTTISQAQYDYAKQRITAAQLDDRITLLCQDYRDLRGQYDRLVSVEMIEAVGHDFLPTYFNQLSTLLKPDGLALIQAITISDQRHDSALKSVDFIQRYIFPGGFLPCIASIANQVKDHTDMTIVHMENIGMHYAQTLRDWRQRFMDNLPAISALGYDQAFIRMWEYYFCYCEGGFRERMIDTHQVLMAKPGYRDNLTQPAVSLRR